MSKKIVTEDTFVEERFVEKKPADGEFVKKTVLKKAQSKINGFGIFTETTIPQDKAFYEVPMNIIHAEPKKGVARVASRMFVDDSKVLNWVNHSCEPNSKMELRNQGLYLVSLRKIAAGEEITVDYLVTEERNNLHECNCKSAKCRNYFATT